MLGVVAIIGVLAAIVLVSLQNARVNARDAQRLKDLETIQGALEVYYRDNGHYPAGGAGSDRACWTNPADGSYMNTTCNPLYPLVSSAYLSSVPYDPGKNGYVGTGCGGAQFYGYWSDGTQYLIGAVQESQGSSGCTQTGNWEGLSATDYTYQHYARN